MKRGLGVRRGGRSECTGRAGGRYGVREMHYTAFAHYDIYDSAKAKAAGTRFGILRCVGSF